MKAGTDGDRCGGIRVLDVSLTSPADNLGLDEVLLEQAQEDGFEGVLRFWESPAPFIVLGRGGVVERECRREAVLADGVPVLRRRSGGGTVVQGEGCLNYTLVLPLSRDRRLVNIRESYRWISARLLAALRAVGVRARFQPVSDLAFGPDQRKFSGNAQRRVRGGLLHHGTVLHAFDLSLIERLLAEPAVAPEYRGGRPHRAFVGNVKLDVPAFKTALAYVMGGRAVESRLCEPEIRRLAQWRGDPGRYSVDGYPSG